MQDILALASANLLTPMILCFALGLFAALARSELTIPEAVAKGMSIYLLFSIGFKGGVAVADHGLDATLIAALVAGVILSFLLPFVAFGLLKGMTACRPPMLPPSPRITVRSRLSPSSPGPRSSNPRG